MTQTETALLVGGIALVILLVIDVRTKERLSWWYDVTVKPRLDRYIGRER